MIPQETVDKILDTAQIADVVGDYVLTLSMRHPFLFSQSSVSMR